MPLPQRFELIVSTPGGVRQHTGSSAGDVQSLEAQVSAAMDATNLAVMSCQSLAPTDVQAWNGIYQGWQSWDQGLQGCIAGTPADNFAPPTVQCILQFGFNWQTAIFKLQGFQSQASTWQARVHAACPNFTPNPIPTPALGPGTPSVLCNWLGLGCPPGTSSGPTTGWPDAIKWIAVLGVLGIVAWAVGPLVAAAAGAGASVIKRRTDSMGDALRARFGNMPLSSGPAPEPQPFGDYGSDAHKQSVLSLIAGE